MNRTIHVGWVSNPSSRTDDRLPRLWRLVLVAICTLILCSCRAPGDGSGKMAAGNSNPAALPEDAGRVSPVSYVSDPSAQAPGPPALPQQAFTGAPPAWAMDGQAPCPPGPPGWEKGLPLPYQPIGPWAPPGIALPWPQDEYLADGGDQGIPAAVTPSRQVRGLEMEDTIVHFDTRDGQTVVEPSNDVFLYSPRFRAVRQVVGANETDQMIASSGVNQPVRLVSHGDAATPGSTKQNLQAVRQIGQKSIIIARTRQGDGALSSSIGPLGFQNGFKPYENLVVIRTGKMEGAELAWLARGTTAAITWTSNQALQILLDRKAAGAVVSDTKVDTLYSVDEPPANPKLRVIKVASTPFAEVGDTVDFTIRFDNVGNQVIGNVVILDSLTTRLEYVDKSAQCSLPAAFSTQQNEGGSVVLRCEIAQPLEPGKGGILRFTCRVR
jgi:uncharacterized repeat protein (TIGR01451 family)